MSESNAQHTPGPWPKAGEIWEPSTPHPEAEPVVRLSVLDYERARVCVDICEGISTHDLETLPSPAEAYEVFKNVQAQRDELAEVAEGILVDDLLPLLPAEYIAKVRAAIAKARGQV